MVAFICWGIRQLFAPNPFEPFGKAATILNAIFGGVLNWPTYRMVGMIYEQDSAPVIGSILYLIIYFANSLVLQGIMALYPHWILMILAVIAYITIYILIIRKIDY